MNQTISTYVHTLLSLEKMAGKFDDTEILHRIRHTQATITWKLGNVFDDMTTALSYAGLTTEEVIALRDHKDKNKAINLYRARTGCDFGQATDYINAMMDRYNFSQ